MGRKEKLKLRRKEEKREIEAANKEKKKKTRVFLVLFLFLALAVYEANIAINNKKENMNEGTQSIGEAENSLENQQIVMETTHGNITLELYSNDAPETVKNFVKLAKEGFYDGIKFHRVISDFMIQAGDPNTKGERGKDYVYEGDPNPDNLPVAGTGGPGYSFQDEINPWSLGLDEATISSLESEGYSYRNDLNSHKNEVGAIAMANSGPNTNGSQFFIITQQDQPHLDGRHTVFGHVVEGMEIVRGMTQGDAIIKMNVIE